MEYVLSEECGGSTTIECETEDEAREALIAWVSGGEYGQDGASTVVRASYTDEDGEETMVDVVIDPTEPECAEGEHDWRSPLSIVGGLAENPGCQGHGGGVIVQELCVRCGCGRETDTWSDDGHGGVMRSVRYTRAQYVEEIAALVAEDQ